MLICSCSDQSLAPDVPRWFSDRGLVSKATWDESTGTLRIAKSVVWGSEIPTGNQMRGGVRSIKNAKMLGDASDTIALDL